MSFAVRLATDQLPVEAGTSTPLDIEIANQSDSTDQYELGIEGLDGEWTAVPVPSFSVSARDIQTQKVFFKPPRTSESVAGNYPFVVKVRSLETGEVRATQGVLQIKPYHHMSMEIMPKKGVYSPLKKQNVFHTTLVNLGNTEHTMQLFGSDPEDALTFEMPTEQVVVGPGQQKEVRVSVLPMRRRPVSAPRLHGFQVSARSIDTPSVFSSAQAQMEQRPAMTAGGIFVFLLVLSVMIGWLAFIPKDPVMDTFMLDRSVANIGETVDLSWLSSNAKSVKITFNGKVIVSAGAPRGTTSYAVDTSGTFEAVAVRDSKTSAPLQAILTVKIPEKPAPPQVVSFDIKQREVAPGESFFVTYKLKDSAKATLTPTGAVLDPKLNSIQITAPSQTGWVKYQIVAENGSETARSREISVNVVQKPLASIVVFRADPMTVDPLLGKTTITWQITGASRAELLIDGQTMELPKTEGEITIDVTKTVQITLIGYDANGVTVKKAATIKVESPPPVDDTAGGSTGGNTTGDTGGGR